MKYDDVEGAWVAVELADFCSWMVTWINDWKPGVKLAFCQRMTEGGRIESRRVCFPESLVFALRGDSIRQTAELTERTEMAACETIEAGEIGRFVKLNGPGASIIRARAHRDLGIGERVVLD